MNQKGFIGLFPLIAIGIVAIGLWLGNLHHSSDESIRSTEIAPAPLWIGKENDEFVRQYQWLKRTLSKTYPNDEFLIVPKELGFNPPGWGKPLPFSWRAHDLYKREKRSA